MTETGRVRDPDMLVDQIRIQKRLKNPEQSLANYRVVQFHPAACFCTALKLRMVFPFFKASMVKKNEEGEYVTDFLHGSLSLKHLLSGYLQEKFAYL